MCSWIPFIGTPAAFFSPPHGPRSDQNLCHKVISSCMGGWESDYVVKKGKGRGGLGTGTGLATLGRRVSLRHHSSVS